jgi:hypothetical protein
MADRTFPAAYDIWYTPARMHQALLSGGGDTTRPHEIEGIKNALVGRQGPKSPLTPC